MLTQVRNPLGATDPTGRTPAQNAAPLTQTPAPDAADSFPSPPEPQSLEQAGVSDSELESMLLKSLLHEGAASGAALADGVCLPTALVRETLSALRDELLIGIKSASGLHDYVYQLTELGHARAKQHRERCAFIGSAPVPIAVYQRAMERQSIKQCGLSLAAMRRALADLSIKPSLVSRLCQAVNDGGGMFLFGKPGNGKTTVAERLCDAFGQYLWIPQMVSVGGDLIRVFDPVCHQRVELPANAAQRYDRRWVLVRRPTVVVGGELTLEQLEANYQPTQGVNEAPIQMKSTGGALLIDDFGRQRAGCDAILNRLIVPLEKGFDYLSLASGRQVRTPFDTLFILSTNLEPSDLVDEAFLRRIPYKIEVYDPEEGEFRALFEKTAAAAGFDIAPGAVDWLLETAYRQTGRELRYCHPRDLLRQVRTYATVHELPRQVNEQTLGVAIENYFATLS
ncbi:hypothetical protein Pla175_33680 [Pirellulimonas nuda]|uniref:AAA+ ATPase domain-containing protein n=1 Tax=Pirellulimonas nuda TaxID=2528009 RepID=A0A518DES1_9BACT|nr:AAA family ATPase [Pirellulimonas nuda]QDU89970.1 hypothetical protein Pla175_33680 [Pirellulimonas nuda]